MLELTIQRGGSTWKPHVTPTGSMPSPGHGYGGPVTRTSLQHHPPPNEQHIGCGYNNSARPFGQNGNVKSIVNKQYNTPVGMYSEESIAETLTAQAEVLANGVLGYVSFFISDLTSILINEVIFREKEINNSQIKCLNFAFFSFFYSFTVLISKRTKKLTTLKVRKC